MKTFNILLIALLAVAAGVAFWQFKASKSPITQPVKEPAPASEKIITEVQEKIITKNSPPLIIYRPSRVKPPINTTVIRQAKAENLR